MAADIATPQAFAEAVAKVAAPLGLELNAITCDEPWQEGNWRDVSSLGHDWPGHQQMIVCPCGSTTFYIRRVLSNQES
jgi:hypothetical protein